MTLIVLASGMLGFLLHNAVDFAIFQPGVGTLFFVTVALAVAVRNEYGTAGSLRFATSRRLRAASCIGAGALVACFWLVVVTPVARSQARMRDAQDWALRAERHGGAAYRVDRIAEPYYDYTSCIAHSLAAATAAAELNRLDPEPPYFYGRLSILDAQRTGKHDRVTLLTIANVLEQAASRAPADFRYYRWLSHLYSLFAQGSLDRERYHAPALRYAQAALERHPTSAELLLEYGLLLEEAGRDAEALQCYERALASETKLLQQQRQMDPRRTNITGRLNKTQTRLLNQRIEQLSRQTPRKEPAVK
jgi:tetratricopeptide (TPR) repeat protein